MRSAVFRVALAWLAFGVWAANATEGEGFALGPGDHVQILVSDFRSGTGEVYQWPLFSQQNQEFVVGPDGRLSVPVIGLVDAAGRTTADIETEIANRLQKRAGLTSRPDASVQIVKFRPLYVTGAVENPGEYDYRPGLTVLQAVSIAGGLKQLTPDLFIGLEKDALSANGDLRVLAADRVSLLARQARIDAEAGTQDAISFPKELASSRDPEALRAIREETLLFDARRDGIMKQTTSLQRNKQYLAGEIDRLKEKSAALAKGVAATEQEFKLISGLVNRGLSGAPRQLELEQNLAQLQSNQLDVEVAIVRANEDIVRADRDAAEILVKYHNDLFQEAQDVRVKLSETSERIQTSRQLVQQAQQQAPALLQSAGAVHPTYMITRVARDGKADTFGAHETDRVRPGDVVQMIVRPDDAVPLRASVNDAATGN